MSEELQEQMAISESTGGDTFEIGDLIYTKRRLKYVYWSHLANKPGVVVGICPQNRYITINIDGQDISVPPAWVEKRTLEGSCSR